MNESPINSVDLNDLTVGYKNKPVLSGLNIGIGKGKFVALLGPNGSGKTTLLRTITRHLKKLSGDIQINGKPLGTYKAKELAKIMSVVMTDKVSTPLLSVFEFVGLGRYPHTGIMGALTSKDEEVVIQSLTATAAVHLAGREMSTLSDGERQKILIARALAQEPQLILLDEPTAHLDLKHRVEVLSILRDLCATQSVTVISSLHDVDIAAKIADLVILVKNGKMIQFGAPELILEVDTVTDLYDFKDAGFSPKLGGIEMRYVPRNGSAFVVGGMGSAANILRSLSKHGYTIHTGLLLENDLDYFVAESLGLNKLTRAPDESLQGSLQTELDSQLSKVDFIVDSGFSINALTRDNLNIINQGLDRGKTVFSLRSDRESYDSRNNTENNVVFCQNIVDLLEKVDLHKRQTIESK